MDELIVQHTHSPQSDFSELPFTIVQVCQILAEIFD